MHRFALFALPFVLIPVHALAQSPDAAPVVAAERAFAADAPSLGIAGSFNKWSVPDAVVIAGGVAQTVREAHPPTAARRADEPILNWWPNFAGIAHSGDLGFTTGGVKAGGRPSGHYFTVWQRQPDTSWKWVYDGGSAASSADVPGPDSEPVVLAPSIIGSASATVAMAEVTAAEAELARIATTDQKAAHMAVLADEGRLYVAQRPPAIGSAQFAEALAAWPATFDFGATQGGGASSHGDMAWTYGLAAWSRDGQPRRGHYVRMWQKRADGWKIVLAQLLPAPPPPPVPPTPPAGG